jgi:hypothetical protein
MYQLNTTYDKTWLAYPTWICGTIELYLGIVSDPLLFLYATDEIDGNYSTSHQTARNSIFPQHPWPQF